MVTDFGDPADHHIRRQMDTDTQNGIVADVTASHHQSVITDDCLPDTSGMHSRKLPDYDTRTHNRRES